MKLNKKLLAVTLVMAVLVVTIIPTVSWYNHNGELEASKMKYTRTNLPISAGAVTMETLQYEMNATDSSKVFYDDKGNKKHKGTALTSDSVSSGKSQFYGTTFTNTDRAPAYVNLYLSNFSNNPKNYIGTISPSLTHKGLSSTVHLANQNVVRIYFQWGKANNWKKDTAKTYLVCNTNEGVKTVLFDTANHVLENKAELDNVTTYYADLWPNTSSFYFATDGGTEENFNTTTGAVTSAWYRTNTITDIHAETGYYLTGMTDDTTWHAQYASFNISGGISLMTFFDKLTINAGQHAYVTLKPDTNYTGASVSYSSNLAAVAVDANTGYVTAGNTVSPAETSKITTTITGALGDTMEVETAILNPQTLSGVSVALNVEVPGAKADPDDNTKTIPGTVEIVWYIQNDSASACSFSNIYFTK